MASPTETLMAALDANDLFQDANLTYDLREGVIWNPAKTRLCILSTDLIIGVYNGLVDEAGPGWHTILQRCGVVWGGRLARRLDQECSVLIGRRMGDMVLEDFLLFFSNYFVFHGWGHLSLHCDRARENGLVEATLVDSIFTDIVDDEDQMADAMICGILSSFVGYLAGRELIAVQTACATKGSDISRFIIGSQDRLGGADAMIKSGRKHDELVATL